MRSILFLILIFYSTLNAIDLGINTRGLDFGFFERKHFKILLSTEFSFLNDVDDGVTFIEPSMVISIQYLSLGKNNFKFNLMSSFYNSWLFYQDDSDHNSDEWASHIDVAYGIDFIKVEPEVFINDKVSIYLNISLFSLDISSSVLYFGITPISPYTESYFPYKLPKVGIRFNF